MKIHFNFTPRKGYNLRDKLWELLQNDDFFKYLSENTGKELRMELRPAVKQGTKQAIFDYYHGPLLDVAVRAFSDAGYESMDKVKADYLLKCECAKALMYKDGEEVVYLEDKASMPKERLVKFVNDAIMFLEIELGVENIPDSSEYKKMLKTGHTFKSVSYDKK